MTPYNSRFAPHPAHEAKMVPKAVKIDSFPNTLFDDWSIAQPAHVSPGTPLPPSNKENPPQGGFIISYPTSRI